MKDKLLTLENQLINYGVGTNLNNDDLLLFPENFRQIHSFKIFGGDLLAINEEVITEGESDEFEKPFRFLSGVDELEIFDREFREGISEDFIQIGCLFGITENVLLNKIKNTIHILHVQDFVALDQYEYKLKNGVCTLEQFIDNLKPQSVSCFLNPKNYSEHETFEIRDQFVLKNNEEFIKLSNEEKVWEVYNNLIENAMKKGFEVHYAPIKILERLGLLSKNEIT